MNWLLRTDVLAEARRQLWPLKSFYQVREILFFNNVSVTIYITNFKSLCQNLKRRYPQHLTRAFHYMQVKMWYEALPSLILTGVFVCLPYASVPVIHKLFQNGNVSVAIFSINLQFN